MSYNIVRVAAVDDGHFGNKSAVLDHNKEIQNQISPTLVSTASAGFVQIADTYEARYKTEQKIGERVTDKEFTVLTEVAMGQQNSLVSTNNANYQTSAAGRVMVNHMLKQMGCNDNHSILLMASSPVERFYKDGERNLEYIAKRRENFLKPVFSDGRKLPQIIEVVEVPEAIAAFYNDYIQYQRRENRLVVRLDESQLKKSCLYIDMGGRTINTGVIDQGSVVVRDCKTFENSGMLAIHEKLQTALKTYRDNISRKELDQILRTSEFTPDLRAKSLNPINVGDHVERAVHEVIENAIGTITSVYNFNDFNRVVFTGGSSARLESHIKQYLPDAEVSPTALYDNVNGMLKYGELKKKEFLKDV